MTAIHDVNMLSLRLCEKGVIPEGAYQTLVDGRPRLSTDEAFHKLLIMVVNAVRVDGKKFDKVLESLKDCGAEELAAEIHKSSEPNGKYNCIWNDSDLYSIVCYRHRIIIIHIYHNPNK